MRLDQATLCFLWRFDGLSERRTKVTQRIELSGSNAGAYVRQVQAGFGSNLSHGMQRLAAEMVAAEKIAQNTGQPLRPTIGADAASRLETIVSTARG